MKRRILKAISLICTCVMLLTLAACGEESQDNTGKYIVFKFGNDNIYLDEVYIYAQTTIDEVKKDELPAMNEKTVVCIFSVSERYYPEERQLLLEEARACRAHTVWFTQEGDAGEAEETCYYGTAQSKNMGYYSLLLLEQVISAMLYRSDDA